MPELPEVETVMRGMIQVAQGATIAAVMLNRADLRWPMPVQLKEVSGNKIVSFSRRSKYIFMQIENNKSVLFHLGMSGKILFHPVETPRHKHDHVIFTLKTAHGEVVEMRFQDARRFGMVDYMETTETEGSFYLKNLGPEPFSPLFNAAYLKKRFLKKRTAIKPTLMDASIVVGVGNIYASESLFRARIHPETPCHALSLKQLSTLVESVQTVLREAIASGGSTLRDYVRSDGGLGYFQHRFAVYGKAGEACQECGGLIEKMSQANRSTFYCPKCQKKNKIQKDSA